ncbi:MAG: sugar ABC transporter permease [Chloroflexaceae bacterium]|nr:sugar ABC transporter permease [Chloroflexaceae bacterium]
MQEDTALLALVGMLLFQIGEGFVVLLVGLHNIPAAYYDIARVDGGNRWQLFRHITLPLLLPWLVLLAIRDMIVLAQQTFVIVYLTTGGGPYYATTTLPLLAYEQVFDGLRFGHGAAIMLLTFLALGAVLLVGFGLVRWLQRGSR